MVAVVPVDLHEADAYRRRQDRSTDRQVLHAAHVHRRALEERRDGRGIPVLRQPELHEADRRHLIGDRDNEVMAHLMSAFFFGHGNSMNAVSSNAYTDAWCRIGAQTPRPKAILSVSAHWYVAETGVTVMIEPRDLSPQRHCPVARTLATGRSGDSGLITQSPRSAFLIANLKRRRVLRFQFAAAVGLRMVP